MIILINLLLDTEDILIILFFIDYYNKDIKTTSFENRKKESKEEEKIPHTGDTRSHDRCG